MADMVADRLFERLHSEAHRTTEKICPSGRGTATKQISTQPSSDIAGELEQLGRALCGQLALDVAWNAIEEGMLRAALEGTRGYASSEAATKLGVKPSYLRWIVQNRHWALHKEVKNKMNQHDGIPLKTF
jgi:hypothetical protein